MIIAAAASVNDAQGKAVAKSTLDKDLKKLVRVEKATYGLSRSLAAPGLLIVFLIGAIALASLSITKGALSHFVIVATFIAAYMALNIGANDVANNMGPAVGSRALTMTGAVRSRSPRSVRQQARSWLEATSSTRSRRICCGQTQTCPL
jgi:hypothetical protein